MTLRELINQVTDNDCTTYPRFSIDSEVLDYELQLRNQYEEYNEAVDRNTIIIDKENKVIVLEAE